MSTLQISQDSPEFQMLSGRYVPIHLLHSSLSCLCQIYNALQPLCWRLGKTYLYIFLIRICLSKYTNCSLFTYFLHCVCFELKVHSIVCWPYTIDYTLLEICLWLINTASCRVHEDIIMSGGIASELTLFIT